MDGNDVEKIPVNATPIESENKELLLKLQQIEQYRNENMHQKEKNMKI